MKLKGTLLAFFLILSVANSITQAQSPEAETASQRMNRLMSEMMEAQARGDRVRVEAIGREMQALAPQVKAEQNAIIERARQQAPAATMQNRTQDMFNQLQQQANTPEWKISIAAREGNLAEVKRLRAAGANINFYRLDPAPPLMEAAINGHVDIAEFLINEGAELRVQKSIITLDALRLAAEAKEDNSAMIKLLVKHGAFAQGDVENLGSAVVKQSESEGKRHMNVQGKQITSGSALMAAIEKNRPVHVKTLLELGASANDWAFGKSALMLAAKKLRPDIVEMLLAHGADPSLTGPESKTALQFAEGTRETPQNSHQRQRTIALLSASRP